MIETKYHDNPEMESSIALVTKLYESPSSLIPHEATYLSALLMLELAHYVVKPELSQLDFAFDLSNSLAQIAQLAFRQETSKELSDSVTKEGRELMTALRISELVKQGNKENKDVHIIIYSDQLNGLSRSLVKHKPVITRSGRDRLKIEEYLTTKEDKGIYENNGVINELE